MIEHSVFGFDCSHSEIIKKKTLEFLSETLPFLRHDPNLPKVAKFGGGRPEFTHGFPMDPGHLFSYYQRRRRDVSSDARKTSPDEKTPEHLLTIDDLARSLNGTARQLCQHGSGT